ncbi:thiamine pyrophosphate-binding protein [Gorillibacterium sp. sgz5001074]|uniref:thiamine pyrophosphate-binding protein n=1 Tax=Gorillibacterium sp. sgz5001074 TaxID=3446695 RepID=UPI003F669411
MGQTVMEKKADAAGTTAATEWRPVNSGQTSPAEGLNAAQYVLKQLAEWGVERIYGVIGDATLYVLDEMAKQNRIRYVPCRHEEAAALMASAEAKLTGKLAVCMATSGPGIVNLMNGLADAAADKVPVMAITGQVDTAKMGTRTKQYIDQQRLMGGITAATELLAHPDALPETLQRLLTEAVTAGTVAHLSVPRDLWRMTVKGVTAGYPAHLHQSMQVPNDPVEKAAALLRQASRPLLYLGRGIASAAPEARELAELASAAVVTTLPARPLFPNDHPLYAGGLGQAGSEAASVLMAEADLLLLLGATWWPDDYAPADVRGTVVQVDAAREQLGMGHPLHHGIVGDLREVLPRLIAALRQGQGGAGTMAAPPDRAPWAERIAREAKAWKAAITEEAAKDGSPVPPQRVMKAVSDAAPEGAVLCVDTGDHTLWFDRIFQAKPGQRVLVSGRWRTLGFALPAAVAASLAEPERRVLAIAGDGGAVQTLMEFQTAVELELPLVLLIIDNGAYAMERNRMEGAALIPLGSAIRNPDFAGVAEACGGKGYRVQTAAELEEALLQSLQARGPSLIQVRTAPDRVPHTKL